MTPSPIERLRIEMESRYRRLVLDKGWGDDPATATAVSSISRVSDETIGAEMCRLRETWRALADTRHSCEMTVLQNLLLFATKLQEEPNRRDVRKEFVKALGEFSKARERLESMLTHPVLENRPQSTPEFAYPNEARAIRDASASLLRLPLNPGFEKDTLGAADILSVEKAVNSIVEAMESMRQKMEVRRVDIRELVLAVVEQHRPLLDEAGIDLSVRLEIGPVRVFADLARLSDAVGELIRNAARHAFGPTHSGPKRIDIRLREEKAWSPGRTLLLEIEDNGRGVSENLRESIWAEGFSGGGGTGHGLAMVRNVIESYGGEVRYGSGSNQGSVFTLRLTC